MTKMLQRAFSFLIITFVLLSSALFPTAAFASSYLPNFSQCPNPGGNVVASYSDGWHWIVGNSTLQWGSDIVYSIGNNNFVQCFCPKDREGNLTGMGTQTKWIYAANLSQDQQNDLKNKGWLWVADGNVFGLASGPYLAQNSSFSCSCNSTIQQSNHTSINNHIDISSKTGGNEVSNNTNGNTQVISGNSSSSIIIHNKSDLNFSQSTHIDQTGGSIHITISGNGDGSHTWVQIGGGQ